MVEAIAREFLVSPSGRGDANLEYMLSRPGMLNPGDFVTLEGGEYDFRSISQHPAVRGTRERPITLRPAPGARPVLCGGLTILGDHTHVNGLEFVGEHDYALFIHKCVGARVEGCHIHDIGNRKVGNGIVVLASAAECVIRRNLIGWSGTNNLHHGIYARHNGPDRLLIAENVFWESAGFNIHVYDEGGDVSAVDVVDNICLAPYGGNICVDAPGHVIREVTARGNWSVSPKGTRRTFFGMRFGHGAAKVEKCRIEDNLIAGAENDIGIGPTSDLEVCGPNAAASVLVNLGRAPDLQAHFQALQVKPPEKALEVIQISDSPLRIAVAAFHRNGTGARPHDRNRALQVARAVLGVDTDFTVPEQWEVDVDLSACPAARGAWSAASICDMQGKAQGFQTGRTDDGKLTLILKGYDYEPEIGVYVLTFA